MHRLRGLYAIADPERCQAVGIAPTAFAEAVLGAGACALQLRWKRANDEEVLALGRGLLPMCDRHGVPFVINDRAEVARRLERAWLHLGQGDMPIERVRELDPGRILGLSTHDLEQLEMAIAARPGYVAFGPVFETRSKEAPDPVTGHIALRRAMRLAHAAELPIVAIGGIDAERAKELDREVDAIAVIGALVHATPADVERAARALIGALDERQDAGGAG